MEDELIEPQSVQEMLKGIDRYNPENLRVLEPYVMQQVAQNTHDISANLAVLKLYQFNPALVKIDVICQILLKALTSLPGPSFSLCECLIDQHLHEDPQIGRLIFLHHLLETCNFQLFWQEINATPELIEGVTGFEDAIRQFICSIVSITYQRVRTDLLLSFLGDVDEYELDHWISTNKWEKLEDGHMLFINNQEEIVKTRNIVEKVGFEKVRNVMQSSLKLS